MLRRSFVLGGMGALAAGRVALAQPQRKTPRVGVLLAQAIPNPLMETEPMNILIVDDDPDLVALSRSRCWRSTRFPISCCST
jgi:hypothetical protein